MYYLVATMKEVYPWDQQALAFTACLKLHYFPVTALKFFLGERADGSPLRLAAPAALLGAAMLLLNRPLIYLTGLESLWKGQ